MQISVESLSSIKKKINFEIPADKVQAEVDKAYAEIRKHAAIKGFRKGKVPMALIEQQYGDKMAQEVVKTLVNDGYYQALTEHKVNPIGYPMIESDALKPGEPFRFSATVEVFPEVQVQDYQGLEVVQEELVQDESVITARLREMQESLAQLVPAPEGHEAKLGDFVVFDFTGTLDGVPFAGGAAEDYQLELGSGRFIPGFEDQMVGMTAGSEGTVKVTFPEAYGNKELAGQPAEFAVKVKEIKTKELPELNDDFGKEFGEFETLEELKNKLRELQQDSEERRIARDLENRLIKALVAKNDLEVPEGLVERQLAVMLENTKRNLAEQRLTLEMMGLTEEGYKVQFREAAREQVKGSLLLEAVADKESLQIGDEEVAAKLAEISASNRQDLEKLTSLYNTNARAKESLIAQMREEKALKFLEEHAKITVVPKEEIKN